MATISLAPPWITRVSELTQLFKYDAEVHVVYNNDEREVKLYVDNTSKANALGVLLPEQVVFGNVSLKITVVPANENSVGLVNFSNKEVLFNTAFEGNGAFSFVKSVQGIFTNNLTYVVFKNKVVQYFNDDLGDVYGQCSTLYQEIAKNVFGDVEGVYYCTDVEEPVYKLGAPLGE